MVHVNYSRVSAIQEDSFPNNKSFLMHSFILMTAGSSDTLFILSIYYIFPSLLICDSLYNKGDHCDELLYNFIIITLTEKVGRCVCVCVCFNRLTQHIQVHQMLGTPKPEDNRQGLVQKGSSKYLDNSSLNSFCHDFALTT